MTANEAVWSVSIPTVTSSGKIASDSRRMETRIVLELKVMRKPLLKIEPRPPTSATCHFPI
jgi:hypothetical protein